MNLVQIYKTLNELVESSIKDKTVTVKGVNTLLDLKSQVHDYVLDSIDGFTLLESNKIFDKLEDIRKNN